MERHPGPTGPFRAYARYMHLPTQFGVTVVVLALAGRYLDGKLDTGPWLMLGGLALGFAAGFYNLVRGVYGRKRGP